MSRKAALCQRFRATCIEKGIERSMKAITLSKRPAIWGHCADWQSWRRGHISSRTPRACWFSETPLSPIVSLYFRADGDVPLGRRRASVDAKPATAAKERPPFFDVAFIEQTVRRDGAAMVSSFDLWPDQMRLMKEVR